MKLVRVTFTGADDSIDPLELVKLSAIYPWVEWGILFSVSSQGHPRFPSESWLAELKRLADRTKMNLSAHLCGGYVRDVVQENNFTWLDIYGGGRGADKFQRIQLNFHGRYHGAHAGLLETLRLLALRFYYQFILQCDGVNDPGALAIANGLLHVGTHAHVAVPLFDTSGGAGLVPAEWPAPWNGFYCGYAGGLGPDNVIDELLRVADVAPGARIWIDMERNVRSKDDTRFELEKVKDVLEKTKHVVQP